MAPQLEGLTLQQVPPFANDKAQVVVSFKLLGPDRPAFVQIYAADAAGTGPANLVDVNENIQFNIIDYQDPPITLRAGSFFTVYACPRTGPQDNPDEYVDGQYWEYYCAMSNIVTQVVAPQPGGGLTPPVIKDINPQPAAINRGNTITIDWTSPDPYYKFLVWWTQNGEPLEQVETDVHDPGSSSGSWVFQTVPGDQYTFQVKGGAGPGGHTYSDWGPTVTVTAGANSSSLRAYLTQSGVNPAGASLRSLMPAVDDLRKFMQL